MTITIERTTAPKQKPADPMKLGFGNFFTDHMFLMDYTADKGWHSPLIVPYGPLPLDPAAMCLHYGQEVFEGMKAYRAGDGRTLLFRPRRNFERMNASNERLCMPTMDVDFCLRALKLLIKTDIGWVPEDGESSLYIRPFIIAVDPFLGVRASQKYMFIIILSPVGAYYPEGMNPVKIYVEDVYVRAARGGVGFTKAAGNYASGLVAQAKAKKMGFTQVLWLDGLERKYVEEVGTMNIFFKIDGEVLTPPLLGSILPGVTRDSCIELLKDWGIKVTERPIEIAEIFGAHEKGLLEEVFGSGTAAVISPVGGISMAGRDVVINNNETGEISHRLYDELIGIQHGTRPDKFGWTLEVK